MQNSHLHSLSLLKLVAVFGILACHTALIDVFDACGRMVEILFLASGFLMAYNHYKEKTIPTGWQIVKSKLPRFYPIHVICFVLQWLFVATWATKPWSFFFSVGLLNLTLQQAWFVRTEFSYNNVSWFLSALAFCYAATPAIKRYIKSFEGQNYGLLKAFLGIIAIRFYCEYLALNAHRYISFDMHCNPFVQMLNYAQGYITAVFFMQKNNFNELFKTKIPAWQLTVLQVMVITVYLLCCYRLADMERAFFVLIALPVFYILAFDRGIIRDIGACKPVAFLSTMTLEIFMFHSFILYKLPVSAEESMSYVIFFVVTMLTAIAYHLAYQYIVKLIKKIKA